MPQVGNESFRDHALPLMPRREMLLHAMLPGSPRRQDSPHGYQTQSSMRRVGTRATLRCCCLRCYRHVPSPALALCAFSFALAPPSSAPPSQPIPELSDISMSTLIPPSSTDRLCHSRSHVLYNMTMEAVEWTVAARWSQIVGSRAVDRSRASWKPKNDVEKSDEIGAAPCWLQAS
jgi:hypothetical protein